MKKTFSIFGMFCFIVVVNVIGTNTYAQSNEVTESQQEITKPVNMTDKMKFLCIQIDVKEEIDQIKDKEQQAQCKKFLDNVSIYEMRELIDKFQGVRQVSKL